MLVSDFKHGKKTVGVTSVQITATDHPVSAGIQLKAADANAGIIYVGNSSAVTADSADATDGFPLSAGQGLLIPISDVSVLFAIASIASQKLFWAVI